MTKYINNLIKFNINKISALPHPKFTNDLEHSELINEVIPSKQISPETHSLFISGMYYHYKIIKPYSTTISKNSFYRVIDSQNGTLIIKPTNN